MATKSSIAAKKTEWQLTQQVWDFGLLFALRRGDLDVSRHAIELGADVNTSEADFMPALHSAVGHNDRKIGDSIPERFECVKLLLDHGADIEKRNSDGEKAISYAARRGMVEIVEFLLDRGANYENVDGRSHTLVEVVYNECYTDAYLIDMLRQRPEQAEFILDTWVDEMPEYNGN